MWEAVIAKEPTEYRRGWPDEYKIVGKGYTPTEAVNAIPNEDLAEVQDRDDLAIIVWYAKE